MNKIQKNSIFSALFLTITLSFSAFNLAFSQEINPKIGDKSILLDNDKENKGPLGIIDLIFQRNKSLKSIMLKPEEVDGVDRAIDSFNNNKPLEGSENAEEEASKEAVNKNQPKEQSRLYLNAILYISKSTWIAWINGTKISSETNDPKNPIYISKIDNNKVNIRWNMGITKWKALTGKQNIDETLYKINKDTGGLELNFSLKTNQTYNLSDNKITEGKFSGADSASFASDTPNKEKEPLKEIVE